MNLRVGNSPANIPNSSSIKPVSKLSKFTVASSDKTGNLRCRDNDGSDLMYTDYIRVYVTNANNEPIITKRLPYYLLLSNLE